MNLADPAKLDRLVSRAALALHDGTPDVLEGVYREAARRSTFDAIAPIDAALASHVAHLTVARVGGAVVLEEALAEKTITSVELPRVVTQGNTVSFDGALLEVLAASSLETARAWLDVATRAATAPADKAYERAEIEAEARKRLRVETDDRALANEAAAFLDRTTELARSIAGEPASLLSVASARSAGDGWPRKLALPFAIETFGADAKARRTIERLCARVRKRSDATIVVVGASTHVRTMARWAFDWHARAEGSAPFSVRHHPEWSEAHGSALLISGALATVPFQKKALALGERTARNQARALDVTRLVAARMDAARLLQENDERAERLFGRSIDAKLARILPRPKRDARGRFRAWLDLPSLASAAQSMHDEDWFRNPRFWEEIEIRFSSPATPKADLPPASALATMFVERLA